MSLKRYTATPEVRAKISLLRPELPRKITAPLRVEPRSKRHFVVGTAFDYLLRFELQRQAPHAVSKPWVAEAAVDKIWFQRDGSGGWMRLTKDDKGVISVATTPPMGIGDEALAREVAGRARNVIDGAKAAVAAYLNKRSPTRSHKRELAAHAIRLAKLDDVYRAGRLDPTFENADQEDIEDLVALLAIVPMDSLLHDKVMLLNPTFGESSLLVGGTDADLITGDMLVDFKTTKSAKMAAADLDQLLGYFLLARRQHQTDPTVPTINRLALYFARHAYLWPLSAETWTSRPEFAEIERWFFDHARRAREASRSRPRNQFEVDQADMQRPIGELLEELKRRISLEWPQLETAMTIGEVLQVLKRSLRVPQLAIYLSIVRTISDLLAEHPGRAERWSRQNGGVSAVIAELAAEQWRKGLHQT